LGPHAAGRTAPVFSALLNYLARPDVIASRRRRVEHRLATTLSATLRIAEAEPVPAVIAVVVMLSREYAGQLRASAGQNHAVFCGSKRQAADRTDPRTAVLKLLLSHAFGLTERHRSRTCPP
jgi:hypothetical protein